MQDIEENLDELFRKAAGNYPVKVKESQWEIIAGKLDEADNNATTGRETGRVNLHGFGLLMIFLMLSLTLAEGIMKHKPGSPEPNARRNEINKPTPASLKTIAAVQIKEKFSPERRSGKITPSQFPATDSRPGEIAATAGRMKQPDPIRGDKVLNHFAIDFPARPVIINKQLIPENKTGFANASPHSNYPLERENWKAPDSPSRQGFYYGLQAGPLFDEVKSQGWKQAGFSMGLVAGYRLNKKFSLETGLIYAKKPYYSSGRYFSMEKLESTMPQDMKIVSLEGKNMVWEIPVKTRFEFLKNEKGNFFSAAGITSYILTHEKNKYLVTVNGSQSTMISSYRNMSNSVASTLDLSAGYEHRIDNQKQIRIEPYVQVPIRGMGVGSMPMISAGVRIGIIRFAN